MSSGRANYSQLLRHPKWQRKRLEVMQAAGFRCSICSDDDSTLNVHHKQYRYVAKPWEYENHELECLCENCHKAEHGIGLDIDNDSVFSLQQFSHECPFVHGRRVDEQMDEFHLCRCFEPTKQLLRLQNNICVRIDLARHVKQ